MASITPAAKPAALCIKPFLSATSPPPTAEPLSAASPSTLMSKEWVVPPRPKPGRKPAVDTPPTKRKAQNREAQRAFRERRAARVGELEDQMEQVREEHQQETESLQQEIEKLQRKAEQQRVEITAWIERYRGLEKQLSTSAASVRLPRRAAPLHNAGHLIQDGSVFGCGRCSTDTNCQCLEDALNVMTSSTSEGDSGQKRPHSPVPTIVSKRVKLETNDDLEVDFTHIYASKAAPETLRSGVVSPTSAAADHCGFCQDGTPCICAEMAAEAEHSQAVTFVQHAVDASSTARLGQLAQYTPPPSEGDVISAQVPLSNSCAGGPGTCAQCRTDPNSTLFCKSLAAARSQSASALGGGCAGGQSGNDACCQRKGPMTCSTRSKGPENSQNRAIAPQGVTLTCADAFTTLSRHPGYEKAGGEIASWMPKLHANVAEPSGKALEDRPAMEIDAANVMAVLREFDRRFLDH